MTQRRIFLYEHLSSGALAADEVPDSMRAEGLAMLRALAEDLDALPDIEVVSLLERRAPFPGPAVRVDGVAESARQRRELAATSDATLVIAPELDGVLEAICREVLELGGRLLGDAETVRLSADKLRTARHLEAHGVPVLPSKGIAAGEIVREASVVKPRFGVGSLGIETLAAGERVPPMTEELIATPLRGGLAASVLAIKGPRETLTLAPCAQHLSRDGRFTWLGGELLLEEELANRARRLARAALDTLPSAIGFIGVDLLLAESADPAQSAHRDEVVEINPRATTSYCGLRAATPDNLAELFLSTVDGLVRPPPSWRPTGVRFDATGKVRELTRSERC